MHPVVVYTLSRAGLFGVTLALLWLLGLQNPLILLLASFLISGVASYVLLSRQRDAMSARISDKLDRPKPQDD
ncbi:hypothetical protein Nocox_02085 [Nonomuraea coxensis DSM 45129]|uniref:DUF4229 domain-containing protein n=1 Tax=Nonomuraea coxensis DSM 45129 TaxID=1122611 RepID=A0ABX8TRF1_9ACTN|nr:DUF4229 domain-containing protein [Nonomuraea coxensis]QYC38050.1 hypothetical protein Nocox_02085 [Nonomuraea coxensis DSM 45129]